MISQEQRVETRYAIDTEVVLDHEQTFVMGATRDASRNGLCLATEKPLTLGEQVRLIPLSDLVLTITNAVSYELVAEVVWTGEDVMEPADSDRRFLVGLQLSGQQALA